jgi:hypothetical protein
MMTRHRLSFLLALFLGILGWSRPVAAGLVLTFDMSTYTINGVGNTTAVEVLVTQTSSGPQVGGGNELLSAAIELSFPTAGTATVVSTAEVTPNPAWSSSSVLLKTNGPNTLVDLGLTSLAGISSIPSTGLLLGTFVFTGHSPGTTQISVTTETPGPSFITAQGNDLDPTNTPSASINVVSGAVPEPSALVLLCAAGVTLGGGWLGRRARSA